MGRGRGRMSKWGMEKGEGREGTDLEKEVGRQLGEDVGDVGDG